MKFSLRLFLIVVGGIGVWLGITVRRANRQARFVQAVRDVNGSIGYRHQADMDWATDSVFWDSSIEPSAPQWLRSRIGDEYFQRVDQVWMLDIEINDEWLSKLAAAPNIRTLKLSGTNVTGTGLRYIRRLRNLELLDLRECPGFSPDGLSNLSSLRSLWALELLNCEKIDDEGLRHLAGLTKLRRLTFGNCEITDAGLEHLQDLTELTVLRLNYTAISDDGLRHLANMKKMKQLDLRGTRVTDAGIKTLLHMKELEQLVLSDTSVTRDAVVRYLPEFRKMEHRMFYGPTKSKIDSEQSMIK